MVSRERRENRELITRLNRDAQRLAVRFRLRYRAIEAERRGVRSHYGICYDDGTIRIRLRHATTGEPLKYSSLVNTLCHELAHLRHFDHGPRFKAFYLALLEFARREGIYRPARRGAAAASPPDRRPAPARPQPDRLPAPLPRRVASGGAPRQLDLFGEG